MADNLSVGETLTLGVTPPSGTRYWVGGSGNWFDYSPGHWALTSGGTPTAGSLGSNLVTNGTFTGNANGWTLGTGWTYGGDKVSHDPGVPNYYTILSQAVPTEIGSIYLITVDVVANAGNIYVGFGGGGGIDISTTGTHSFEVEAKNTTSGLGIQDLGGFDGSVDNVEVKKITSNIPVYINDVVFDGNSGLSGETVSITKGVSCRNFTSSTGVSYTIDMTRGYVELYNGSLTFESGIAQVGSETAFYFYGSGNGSHTITPGGNTAGIAYISIESEDGSFDESTYTLMGDLVMTKDLYIDNCILNLNGFNWKSNVFEVDSYGADNQPSVYLGSGTVWTKFFDIYSNATYPINMHGENASIKISNISGTATPPYIGTGGFTYGNIWITEMGSTGQSVIMQGYYNDSRDIGVFDDFKIEPGVGVELDQKVTVNTFSANGTPGNLIKIDTYTKTYTGDGNELVTNGGFTGNANGWSYSARWTYGGNQMSFDGTSDLAPYLSQTIAITPGLRYVISFDVTSPQLGMSVNLGGDVISANAYSTGTYVMDYAIAGVDGTISFQGTNVAGSIDNVSVQLAIPANQFTLSKSSGVVYCNYLDINNSNATGGAVWRAGVNSIDNGNNTGWQFDQLNLPISTGDSQSVSEGKSVFFIPTRYRESIIPTGGGSPSERTGKFSEMDRPGSINITS